MTTKPQSAYEAAPDPDNDIDSDDNGTLNGNLMFPGAVFSDRHWIYLRGEPSGAQMIRQDLMTTVDAFTMKIVILQ
ncbi:MAG: hypothetical protein IPF93_22220 [Saprospiraceae bacterium]|nr:hypothetical protein [Saprospiraceae bacterium]